MGDLTTYDFVLFEDGEVLNNDSLINRLKALGNYEGEFTLEIQRTNVDNAIGNIYYYNHDEITVSDTTHLTFDWIESAGLRKVDDQWKLEFFHSTVRK